MGIKCGLLVVFLTVLASTWTCDGGRDRVLVKDMTTVTLRQGQMTAGRRSAAVYQLQCVGGYAGCSVPQPKIVQCYNRGFDGRDVQWECKGQMDKRFKFGQITVSCEGYDYPDDPYILHGSCGLEYELDYTDTDNQNDDEYYNHEPYRHHHGHHQSYSGSERKGSVVGSIIALVIVGFLVFACCKMCQAASHSSGSAAGSGTGPTPSRGSGPGFWSGAGIGGALGYLFGRGGGGHRRGGYYGGGGGYYGGGSGYYGGGSRGMFGGGSSHRSSHGSSSGSTHTSTSFGGTKRR